MKWRFGLLTLFSALFLTHASAVGLSCSKHPLYKPGFVGELPRGWMYAEQEDNRLHWSRSAYMPRYSEHTWAPKDNPTSNKYKNLDFFVTGHGRKSTSEYCTLYFQRKAKAYLFVSAYKRGFPDASLTGWKFEGWAELAKGDPKKKAVIGITKKSERHVPRFALVFSKPAAEMITLPDYRWIGSNLQGVSAKGYYHVMVGEADGSSVKKPEAPNGVHVPEGGRCPDALHDTWKVKGPDESDPLTSGKMYRTWHPVMDPCYWCGYDHEHGSSSKELMGHTPRYGYVAEKNKNEKEEHKGFKGIVFPSGEYLVYYGFHSHLSDGRRFETRFHTIEFVIANAKTKETLLALRFKADFGFLATRLKARGMYALTEKDKKMQKMQEEERSARNMRIVNVINPGNLDPRFKYRDGKSLLHGQYEQWKTTPICGKSRRHRETTFDIRDPGTAMRRPDSGTKDIVKLGRTRDGNFQQQASVNRQLRVNGLMLSDRLCVFELPNILGMPKAGKFYTDPYGKILLAGHGANAVAQYVKPGFSHSITGDFEVTEPWLGLHKDGVHGRFPNIMYSVDPASN